MRILNKLVVSLKQQKIKLLLGSLAIAFGALGLSLPSAAAPIRHFMWVITQ